MNKKLAALAVLLFLFGTSKVHAQSGTVISVGPLQNNVSGDPLKTADIFSTPTLTIPIVAWSGGGAINVDGISFGKNIGVGAMGRPLILFGVGFRAQGVGGSGVNSQFPLGRSQTHVYGSDWAAGGKFSNVQVHDGDTTSGLLGPLGLEETASGGGVDGLDRSRAGQQLGSRIYWTVDRNTTLNNLIYSNRSGADVFSLPVVNGYALNPVSFATHIQLTLDPEDEIDALEIIDRGLEGTFDQGDVVLFSLRPRSPSLPAGTGPGTIFMKTFNGTTFVPLVSPAELGLLPDDDINALIIDISPNN